MKNFFITTKAIKTLTLVAAAGIMTTLAACNNATDNPSASVSEPQTEEVTAASSTNQALAQQLQGKPVVVDIYADWCAGCKKIKPTLEALKKEYGDTANFVVFDVTDKSTTEASEAKAKELGLEDVFAKYKAKTATVAVMNPGTGEVVELFQKNQNKADYVAALDTTSQQINN
ncbi:MAG: thioredoxin domain-containing protein [Cyanobacteria bacterium P01_C01_bin.38]